MNQTWARAPLDVELRHLRYFVALADAGSFTRAAERMYVAQPTISQQIRQLEEFVGAQLLQRRPDGVKLTSAGSAFLDASRDVLSLMEHSMSRTRRAAGLGRQRLRVLVPPRLPDTLAVETASALRSAADGADIDIVWLETPLDPDFSLIRERRADAGLGWLTVRPEALPSPLEVMTLGDFEPELWVPSAHEAARRGSISLTEMARMRVIYGPRRVEAATYDAWTSVLRQTNPMFEFTDPPIRHSLPIVLAFAAEDMSAAVLTGPSVRSDSLSVFGRLQTVASYGMTSVTLAGRSLTATAALAWNGDLPSALQQVLFDAADSFAGPVPAHIPVASS